MGDFYVKKYQKRILPISLIRKTSPTTSYRFLPIDRDNKFIFSVRVTVTIETDVITLTPFSCGYGLMLLNC